jgi:glycosyltransferase involved in cell wall biosynthesis
MLDLLTIISNDSVYKNKGTYYCDNIDSKSIPEGLSKNYEIINIARESKIERSIEINIKNTITNSNIFSFLYSLFKTFKEKKSKYLLISISPYTFFASLLLIIFKKNFIIYIRSSGYEEYKKIIGLIGPAIYHIMFSIVSLKAKLIACNERLLEGKKGTVVTPSQLNEKWFNNHNKPDLTNVNLLYVGRIKVEKGIFSLLDIFKSLNKNINLTIVGTGLGNHNHLKKQSNIKIIDFNNKDDSIIKVYDSHNIFILPSFTEGYSQVIDESLVRCRPVIIFKEISHVVYSNRRGVFVCDRNPNSLSAMINHIMDNYESIEKKMLLNKYPTKDKFIDHLSHIVKDN